jgi:hypothetical protein
LANITFFSQKKQTISESAFAMRLGEDGLSVDWNNENTAEHSLERVGHTYKTNKTEFKNKADFMVYELDVDFVRQLEFVSDVVHDPVFNDPEILGKPNNPAHALIINTKDEEVRVKLRDHAKRIL